MQSSIPYYTDHKKNEDLCLQIKYQIAIMEQLLYNFKNVRYLSNVKLYNTRIFHVILKQHFQFYFYYKIIIFCTASFGYKVVFSLVSPYFCCCLLFIIIFIAHLLTYLNFHHHKKTQEYMYIYLHIYANQNKLLDILQRITALIIYMF